MIYPNLNLLSKIIEKFNRITFYKEIVGDIFTPVTILKNFSNEENLFLFESANLDKTFSRFSFFSKSPENIYLFYGKSKDPINFLISRLTPQKVFRHNELGNFSGGLVGFLGFETVNYMNILRQPIKEKANELIAGFLEIDKFYIFDNFTNRLYAAVSLKTIASSENLFKKAKKILSKMTYEVFNTNEDKTNSQISEQFILKKEYSKEEFIEKVNLIKREIINGETIQTVFSQKYEIENRINPVSFYRAIRHINPSPYLFYLKFGKRVILGSSPETHLKITNGKALLKPIAGTYPIGKNIEKIKKDLLNDEKEYSEHLMLLDLARNDLYQGCKIDSVKVSKPFTTEVYSHVVHIVSEVEGELKNNISPFELFIKTFPAGTVSGAPKVRAIELIDKYENSTRGFYAGCVGYFGYNGNLDTCITIRSAFIEENKIILRAGAGIVYDSIPEKEFLEVENKLGALFKALKMIKNIEVENVFNG